MRYRYSYIVMLLVATMLMLGCADQDAPKRAEELVGVDLAFTVPAPADITGLDVTPTRMDDGVVQITAADARNLEDVIIIPFTTANTITINDTPAQYLSYAGWSIFSKTNSKFYYNRKCQFVQGVASVLVYGHGAYSVANYSGEDKYYYGSTTAVIPPSLTPKDIHFDPTQIRATTEYDEKGLALAAYLTAIAKTEGWSTTTDSKLKALYFNFIGKREGMVDHRIFAGSSQSILGYVKELYKEVSLYTTADAGALSAAILANIAKKATVENSVVTKLHADLQGYPANIDLPDGAAAIQWISSEEGFVPQTTTTTIAPITSVTRFAYPAELYYYTNSQIATANKEISASKYESETIWNNVLQYYTGSGVVDASTRAVAIKTPMQYGVARLCTNLNAAPNTLIDGDGTKFIYGTNSTADWNDRSFPMTAVIVGGQYPVGFDFKPETVKATAEEAKADMRYVYDSQVKTRNLKTDYYYLGTTSQNNCTNTLVLQSYENAKVTVVLEFENRTDKKFKGKDCIVYPGAKFYLIGYVDPTVKPGSGEQFNRVFTQDYVTTFNMTVDQKCLANAYSVMPDLSEARMEIGVLIVPKWDVITPTNVEVF